MLSPEYIKTKIETLEPLLLNAINSATLLYKEVAKVDEQGLYIIFNDEAVLYIGKTNRIGKIRMQELAADFRSHTFNRKLLSQRFKDLGFVFETLKSKTKKDWIENGSITIEDFKAHQKEINQFIRQKLKFKFFPVPDESELITLEHFAIAVLNPLYND